MTNKKVSGGRQQRTENPATNLAETRIYSYRNEGTSRNREKGEKIILMTILNFDVLLPCLAEDFFLSLRVLQNNVKYPNSNTLTEISCQERRDDDKVTSLV